MNKKVFMLLVLSVGFCACRQPSEDDLLLHKEWQVFHENKIKAIEKCTAIGGIIELSKWDSRILSCKKVEVTK